MPGAGEPAFFTLHNSTASSNADKHPLLCRFHFGRVTSANAIPSHEFASRSTKEDQTRNDQKVRVPIVLHPNRNAADSCEENARGTASETPSVDTPPNEAKSKRLMQMLTNQ
jgi:hypothetical protein